MALTIGDRVKVTKSGTASFGKEGEIAYVTTRGRVLLVLDDGTLTAPLAINVTQVVTTPPPEPEPEPPAVIRPLLGIDGRPDWPERLAPCLNQLAPAVRIVRIASDRLSFGSTKTDQTFAAIRAVGAEPLLLFMNWRDTPANVRRWVDRYSIKYLELGNEVFYTSSGMTSTAVRSSARLYASQAKAIKLALPATCKLLIEADFPHFGGAEVAEIKATVPDIARYADGVKIHPYSSAAARIATMYSQLATLGFPPDVPVWVTEYGISTANGRRLDGNYDQPLALTYAEAAARVRPAYDAIRSLVRNLAVFVWYQDIDQGEPTSTSTGREAWFGVFRRDATPKGEFTAAVKALG